MVGLWTDGFGGLTMGFPVLLNLLAFSPVVGSLSGPVSS